jgi:hypothetical protein
MEGRLTHLDPSGSRGHAQPGGERVLAALTPHAPCGTAAGRCCCSPAPGSGETRTLARRAAWLLAKTTEQCWPASDRQRCCVRRARNLYAKLPERGRERVKHSYWQALDDAINERDAKQRLQTLPVSVHATGAERRQCATSIPRMSAPLV